MLEGGFLDYFFDYAVDGMFSDFKTETFSLICVTCEAMQLMSRPFLM
jgi:hypothetical protein